MKKIILVLAGTLLLAVSSAAAAGAKTAKPAAQAAAADDTGAVDSLDFSKFAAQTGDATNSQASTQAGDTSGSQAPAQAGTKAASDQAQSPQASTVKKQADESATSEPTDVPAGKPTETDTPQPEPTSTPVPTAEASATESKTQAQAVSVTAENTPTAVPANVSATAETKEEQIQRMKKEIMDELKKPETKEERMQRLKKEIMAELREEISRGKYTKHAKIKGTTAGFFMETSLSYLALSIGGESFINNSRLGSGDDGIFGVSFIYEGMSLNYKYAGVDNYDNAGMIAFDFYPLGRSPSGIYLGPIIGGSYFSVDGNIGYDLLYGGEAGVRFLMNFVVLDIGADYRRHVHFTNNISYMEQYTGVDGIMRGFTPHISLGVIFYGSDADNASRKKRVAEGGTTAGHYFEIGGLGTALDYFMDDIISAELKFGSGDEGIFGLSFTPYAKYKRGSVFLSSDFYYYGGVDICAEFFPLAKSPAGLYLGPVVGGGYYHGETDGAPVNNPYMKFGLEAGLRILMNCFVFDMSVAYTGNVEFGHYDHKPSLEYGLQPHAGIGFMFYGDKKKKP